MNLAFLAPYRTWWEGLMPRERQILAVGGVVLLFFVFYLLIWAPMQRDLTRLRASVPEDRSKVALMRAQSAQAQQLRARLPTATQRGNLLSMLEQSASARGLRQSINRMEPEGANGARLILDEVSFNALLSWIADLQGQGIRVENATIQKRPTAGLVQARVLLRAPGA